MQHGNCLDFTMAHLLMLLGCSLYKLSPTALCKKHANLENYAFINDATVWAWSVSKSSLKKDPDYFRNTFFQRRSDHKLVIFVPICVPHCAHFDQTSSSPHCGMFYPTGFWPGDMKIEHQHRHEKKAARSLPLIVVAWIKFRANFLLFLPWLLQFSMKEVSRSRNSKLLWWLKVPIRRRKMSYYGFIFISTLGFEHEIMLEKCWFFASFIHLLFSLDHFEYFFWKYGSI